MECEEVSIRNKRLKEERGIGFREYLNMDDDIFGVNEVDRIFIEHDSNKKCNLLMLKVKGDLLLVGNRAQLQ